MIMERVDTTIDDLVKREYTAERSLAFEFVLKTLISGIEGLRKIHGRGIVHGDIHPGNVVLLRDGKVGFIDFERSFHEDEAQFRPDTVFESGKAMQCYHTHWNMQGFRASFRDDIVRLMMVAGFMFNGPAWTLHCVGLSMSPILMMHFKLRDNFFHTVGRPDPVGSLSHLSEFRKERIWHYLVGAQVVSRAVSALNEKPHYELILRYLRSALELARPNKCTSCTIS